MIVEMKESVQNYKQDIHYILQVKSTVSSILLS